MYERITNKEKEIMLLVAKGLSNNEIGKLLNISESTVKTHVKHILGKTYLKNRAQLIAFYYTQILPGDTG